MKIGIDIGSREVKIYYVTKEDNGIMKRYSTIKFYQRFGSNRDGEFMIDSERLIEEIGISQEEIEITVTGYGRNNIKIEGVKIIPEIEAHVTGASIQTGLSDFTLLDMGGQDTKVIAVKDGVIDDFVMNDRCAAGTGRYLENIAEILYLSLEEVGKCNIEPIELNHTCAIFAETEIVTKITAGYSPNSLCAGANLSVARRVLPLINRFDSKKLVVVGGVARNNGVIYFISKEITAEIIIPSLPQFNGAIGCSSYR